MHRYFRARLHLRRLVTPLFCFGLFLYFLFHLLHGERGYMSLKETEARIQVADAQFQRISAERQALEHRVHLLRPDSICPDLLEERARKVLGYTHPDELIILSQ